MPSASKTTIAPRGALAHFAAAARLCAVLVLGLAAMLAVAVPALAHPHVWIKVRTELVVEGGALTGLKHTWVFDESWLANQLEEHDKDKDGRLTPAELAPLAAESRSTLETFRSFTVVRAGGGLVRAVKPRDVTIAYYGNVLGMTFTVSLAKPLPLKGDMLLEVYDAGYFSGFSFEGEDAVVFAGGAPEGCSVKSGVSPSPQQMRDYRQMLKEIGPELSKPFTPTSVAISCGAAPPMARGPNLPATGLPGPDMTGIQAKGGSAAGAGSGAGGGAAGTFGGQGLVGSAPGVPDTTGSIKSPPKR